MPWPAGAPTEEKFEQVVLQVVSLPEVTVP
jgi:hypothetical protein